MQDRKVSIVIRTIPDRIHFLDQALFSIFCSDYSFCEVVVVVQSKDDSYYEEVLDLSEVFLEMGLSVRVIRNPTNSDQRAKNLNLGITASTGRYLSFLDDDDILYPTHISSLVKILDSNDSLGWVYSDTVGSICEVDSDGNLYIQSRHLFFKKPRFSYPELWFENFIPLHSYMIDRYKVDKDLIHFDESFTVLEDYAFLLKLAMSHEPKYHSEVTCEYRFRLDGSNSTCLVEEMNRELHSEKQKKWGLARNQINQFKQDLISSMVLERNKTFFYTLIDQSQIEFREMRLRAEQLQLQSEQAQAQLVQTQAQLAQSQEVISAMESSKFWKIRKMWFRLKGMFSFRHE